MPPIGVQPAELVESLALARPELPGDITEHLQPTRTIETENRQREDDRVAIANVEQERDHAGAAMPNELNRTIDDAPIEALDGPGIRLELRRDQIEYRPHVGAGEIIVSHMNGIQAPARRRAPD